MPSTTRVTHLDGRLAKLRAALAAVDDEAASDPLEHAIDLPEWQARETERNNRRLQIMQELRRREELGELADDSGVLAAIRSYTGRVSDDRAKLAAVSRDRHWPATGSDSRATSRLTRWWAAILDLDRALPGGHAAADRYVSAQIQAWYAARDGVIAAKLDAGGGDVPAPEIRGRLPRGVAYGVHRATGGAE